MTRFGKRRLSTSVALLLMFCGSCRENKDNMATVARSDGQTEAKSEAGSDAARVRPEAPPLAGVLPPPTDPDMPLRKYVLEQRRREWRSSTIVGKTVKIYQYEENPPANTQTSEKVVDSFLWNTGDGTAITLKISESRKEGAEVREGWFAENILVQLRAVYLGTNAAGAIVFADEFSTSISAESEMENHYIYASQRADGTVLITIASHLMEMTENGWEPPRLPTDQRKTLLAWSPTFKMPIVVADWHGEPDKVPGWAK